ncbi:Lrp/AsnC family transcriptional regulator [Croceicoccus bisphenolivorans]|uniref:Lrp/AsnC family transcriptional regulator n=1 Tax=Croceicoccus bisphenolivorans TaxID=1783232 RepID=UPI00082F4CF1|nr:Lrp/AsnC family transcriptional regulator [Croceicoccus bisphenolivorans]
MDETDLKILRQIQANPDISLADLGPAVGLSQTPCWRRLKKLEQNKVIVGRAVLLDPSAIGLGVNVFAHLKLTNHRGETLEMFEEAVAECPEIIECFSMSGESDYMLRIVAKSIDHYERFMKDRLSHLPEVVSINSSFALKCVKDTRVLPV